MPKTIIHLFTLSNTFVISNNKVGQLRSTKTFDLVSQPLKSTLNDKRVFLKYFDCQLLAAPEIRCFKGD